MEIKRKYRPEIEGIRVIAALLVAIYHIWLSRVSGGVDVFFVVSGFLITTSLLSKYARDGYIKIGEFMLNLFRRLLPHAFIVLIFTTISSYFILPEVRYFETIREILASIFYYENWQLAVTGTDYLGQNNQQSPVQHFWAMSMQGQFYIVWFLVIAFSILLSKKFKYNFKKILLTVLIVLFIISFTYSVYLTGNNQTWAYFDTGTRLWEFAMGGLLLLFIFQFKLPLILSFVFGWSGFIMLALTGVIFNVGASFPGYIAIVPVLAAVFMLLAGQNPTKYGVEKLLGSRPMVWLGGLSYGIYLWHWPLLIFFYEFFDTSQVSFISGILIIVLSILLSYIVNKIVEKPFNKSFKERSNVFRSFSPVIFGFIILVVMLGTWYYVSLNQNVQLADIETDADYLGALVNHDEYASPPELNPIPSLTNLTKDISRGCLVSSGDSTVDTCEFGKIEDYKYKVALVGGSKSAHWFPSLEAFAYEEDVKITVITKSGCRFSTDEDVNQDCYEWNQDVIETIVDEDIDLVVTLADINRENEERIPDGILEQFNRLNEYDIDILALRDTPTFPQNIAECLNGNDLDARACGIDKTEIYGEPSGWEQLKSPPSNVAYVDYINYFCPDNFCSPIIGNVIVYRDHHHLTATFAESLGPILQSDVMHILNSGLSDMQKATERNIVTQNNSNTYIESVDNLINLDLLIEGKWIDTNGVQQESKEMYQTLSIEYSKLNQYLLNSNAYVSYYNGEEFIKTIRYYGSISELPHNLDDVESADHIILSFSEDLVNDIELKVK